ncbi:GLPGLI family protein [Panacibacter ginsenosidivorans]|uniref:GLPGLI family protein n=1 Tax=Panacibacter ginsenosidivorans TaxID=1813871 RepID=A0A5B8V8X2_9BACT|nr:GLPGLI family protein [Panacibacter ginsenosidivorans]QEC67864.1 GLPGLI family protein [Panacibacter ginsenosidivorans]
MKRYAVTAFMLFCAAMANAQIKEGTIIYERKADLHRRMQDEQMKAMVPQFRTDKQQLFFKENISVYKAIAEDEAPDPFDDGNGGRIMIRIGGPGDGGILYKNFSTQQFFEQTSLGDKDFIIDDTVKAQPWKLSDETKVILGHTCKKATVKTSMGSDVTAWYTDDIPLPIGPENFNGLPGAILMMDVNNAEIVFTAVEIKNVADAKELKVPSSGKHISRADFQKKMDELFGPPTPDGRRIITREN